MLHAVFFFICFLHPIISTEGKTSFTLLRRPFIVKSIRWRLFPRHFQKRSCWSALKTFTSLASAARRRSQLAVIQLTQNLCLTFMTLLYCNSLMGGMFDLSKAGRHSQQQCCGRHVGCLLWPASASALIRCATQREKNHWELGIFGCIKPSCTTSGEPPAIYAAR